MPERIFSDEPPSSDDVTISPTCLELVEVKTLTNSGMIAPAKVPQEMKDELEFVKESRKLTLDLLKPGTPCKDIWEQFNAFMRKNGRPEESRLYCHGQGYDLVERPLIRSDEPWTIAKDMNIVVHPTYAYGGYLNWLCDNYIIGGNGPGDRLHQFKEEVVEAG